MTAGILLSRRRLPLLDLRSIRANFWNICQGCPRNNQAWRHRVTTRIQQRLHPRNTSSLDKNRQRQHHSRENPACPETTTRTTTTIMMITTIISRVAAVSVSITSAVSSVKQDHNNNSIFPSGDSANCDSPCQFSSDKVQEIKLLYIIIDDVFIV